jgi:hypothetical protein
MKSARRESRGFDTGKMTVVTADCNSDFGAISVRMIPCRIPGIASAGDSGIVAS